MSISARAKKTVQILQSVMSSPGPANLETLVFAVTFHCNAKCTMCNIWQKMGKEGEAQQEELTLREIREHFTTSTFLRQVRFLGITGGEPFLREDFVELILLFYEINPSVRVYVPSNGLAPSLIGGKLKALHASLQRENVAFKPVIGFSVDGTEGTHDRMRGVQGSYRKTIQSLESTVGMQGVEVEVSFTFTPENFREFLDVFALSRAMNVRCGIQFAQTGNYYANEEKHFLWTDEQISELRDLLTRTGYLQRKTTGSLSDRMAKPDQRFLEYVLQYQRKPHRSFDCFSGTHSCYMDPYGNVFPCIVLDKTYGNIRGKGFDALWTSRQAADVRQTIAQRGCSCCSFCDIPASLSRDWRTIAWNVKKMVSTQR